MPGLLQTQAEHFTKTKYVMALCAEFLGSMLFSFTGSALLSVALADAAEPNVVMAALGNAAGITIAGISGGKPFIQDTSSRSWDVCSLRSRHPSLTAHDCAPIGHLFGVCVLE